MDTAGFYRLFLLEIFRFHNNLVSQGSASVSSVIFILPEYKDCNNNGGHHADPGFYDEPRQNLRLSVDSAFHLFIIQHL